MKQISSPLPTGYFQALYTANADPWGLASSDYERRKYQATLDVLPPRRFRSIFEIGCAIGILTRLLAQHADLLLAVDIEDIALDQARINCSGMANVQFERMAVPASWPDQKFDLILLSEVLYYFLPEDVVRAAERARRSLSEDGLVVLVHWIRPTDLPLLGDVATEIFLASAGPELKLVRQIRTPDYRIDTLSFDKGSDTD